MTPDELAASAVDHIARLLWAKDARGDTDAGRMLADVRERRAFYVATLVGLLVERPDDACPACRATGYADRVRRVRRDGAPPCSGCGGTGIVRDSAYDGGGFVGEAIQACACGARSRLPGADDPQPCPECGELV